MQMEYGICIFTIGVQLMVWGSSVTMAISPFRWRIIYQNGMGLTNVIFGPLGITLQRRLTKREQQEMLAMGSAAQSPAVQKESQ